MQDRLVQSIRYKLQKRVRRLNSADHNQFHPLLGAFFQFLEQSPLLAGVRDELIARTAGDDISRTCDRIIGGEALHGTSEAEAAAMGYEMLKRIVADPETASPLDLGMLYGSGGRIDECLDT